MHHDPAHDPTRPPPLPTFPLACLSHLRPPLTRGSSPGTPAGETVQKQHPCSHVWDRGLNMVGAAWVLGGWTECASRILF